MNSNNQAHNAFVQLMMHTENVTWSRFYNYLMAMTFLILAWATIYAANVDLSSRQLILISISVIGFMSGLFWAALGYRGRSFLHAYMAKGSEIEADPDWGNSNTKPITLSVQLRDNLPFKMIASKFILVTIPLSLSILYAILFFASVCR